MQVLPHHGLVLGSRDYPPLNLQSTLLPAGTSPCDWHMARGDVVKHWWLLSPSNSRLIFSNDGMAFFLVFPIPRFCDCRHTGSVTGLFWQMDLDQDESFLNSSLIS